MPSSTATVTSKGQVTIPKAIRESLDIRESDRLLFVMEEDRLVVIPLRRRPLGELYNALPATRPFPGQQAVREEIRGDLAARIARGDE